MKLTALVAQKLRVKEIYSKVISQFQIQMKLL